MYLYLRLKDDSFFVYKFVVLQFVDNELLVDLGGRLLTYPIDDIFAFRIVKEELL